MSEWDFGYGREPAERPEPRYPQQQPYSYPEPQEPQEPDYPYDPADQPDAAGWPGADGYPAAEDGYDPPAGYPITYERDEFEGRTSPAPAFLRGAARPGPAPSIGERDAADRTQAWYPDRQRYPQGPDYPGPDQA